MVVLEEEITKLLSDSEQSIREHSMKFVDLKTRKKSVKLEKDSDCKQDQLAKTKKRKTTTTKERKNYPKA